MGASFKIWQDGKYFNPSTTTNERTTHTLTKTPHYHSFQTENFISFIYSKTENWKTKSCKLLCEEQYN